MINYSMVTVMQGEVQRGKKTRELTNEERENIVIALTMNFEDGKLAKGSIKTVALQFHVCRHTISWIWKNMSLRARMVICP